MKQAILLAAGESSRFWPLARDYHKSELSVCGATLIDRTITMLQKHGFEEIVIVYLKDKKPKLSDHSNIKVILSELDKPDGMGYALLSIKQKLDDTFLVIHPYHFAADTYLDRLLAASKTAGSALLLTQPAKQKQGGLAFLEDNHISEIKETDYMNQKNAYYVQGVYCLNSSYIQVLEAQPQEHYSFETALSKYVKDNNVRYVITEMPLLSLKYPWHLFSIKDYLLRGEGSISSKATIDKTAIIDNNVIIEDGATVGAYAVIRGPSYIGADAYIGDHTLVRDKTVIEKDALVGAFTEVKNTLLMSGSSAQGYVADSIVGRNVKIAHGFTTGNRRIDRGEIHSIVKNKKISTGLDQFGIVAGDNVSFGINVSTMPGVMLGQNSIIGPSTTVYSNVEDGTRVFHKNQVSKKSE